MIGIEHRRNGIRESEGVQEPDDEPEKGGIASIGGPVHAHGNAKVVGEPSDGLALFLVDSV